ncbi:MAG: NADH-quinone oxidoreductase subunit M [Chloroflexi bacterium]|nr:NADH-quinone oxidoreductase subunit M [Chloroflexota bacterium]
MNFVAQHLLSLILFTPLAGMALIALVPGDQKQGIRWVAFLSSLVPLALSVVLWLGYNPAVGGFQFEEHAVWYAAINSAYHLGVDGISVPMILLTGILTPLAILISFSVEDRPKMHMMLFLMLETGMMGVFLSLDLILFFLFWEIGLVPMYFLINVWGGKDRRYASFKFFVYTMAGSVGMLLAIQIIGLTSGTFDMVKLFDLWPAFNREFIPWVSTGTLKAIAFWAFTIAFAIKVPVWPLHTWLPDAHTEAPTAGSMLLAGVLLKLGAYGFLRLVLPLYPQESYRFSGMLALFALLAILFGAYAAYGQTDFKRLVAYSSVNHMGFVVLGIAVAAWARQTGLSKSDAIIATNGAVLQMFAHGLSSAAMFLLVGVIYDRTHTRQFTDFGGLWPYAPVYGGILIFCAMASVGLPGLSGFVAEFMVVRGSWPVYTLVTALSMLGLLFTGAYLLKAIQKVLHGPVNQKLVDEAQHHGVRLEIGVREVVAVAPLMALMLFVGIWPAWITNVINAAVTRLMG